MYYGDRVGEDFLELQFRNCQCIQREYCKQSHSDEEARGYEFRWG